MSNASKGTAIEKRAKDVLEGDGWLVHRTVRTPIVLWKGGNPKVVGSHANDIFGAFDLAAVMPDKVIRFIQVTTSDMVGARQKKVFTVASRFPAAHASLEVWGWVGGAKRINRNFTREKVFIRRQYFRKMQWSILGWRDITDPFAGWIDDWLPAGLREVKSA